MVSKHRDSESAIRFGAKANFIRCQPDSMSAREIVAAAAKQGFKISVNHVYNLRHAAQKKGKSPRNAEQQLRTAIAQLGLRRSREIFLAMADAFRGK